MKLKKAAYGLVEAPVVWYLSRSTVLEEHGWRRLKSGPMLLDIDRPRPGEKNRQHTRSDDSIRLCRGNNYKRMYRSLCVRRKKQGNKIWETERKRLQFHFRKKM